MLLIPLIVGFQDCLAMVLNTMGMCMQLEHVEISAKRFYLDTSLSRIRVGPAYFCQKLDLFVPVELLLS